MEQKQVRVRFPPSPTGPMHVGTARALLFNFLFAQSKKGVVVFRSEDTDQQRSRVEFEQEILAGLKWLGLSFDEGPFRQSQRGAIYEQYFAKLRATGKIYPCFCSADELQRERTEQKQAKKPPRYSGKCRRLSASEIEQRLKAGLKPAWRFRVPAGELSFQDLIRGQISERGENLADFVIRRADGQFLYHFTVVVDDAEMRISHVIRGEDHLTNTSKHLLLFDALRLPRPKFAHLPLLLNPDRTKMSKRDEGGRPATLARLIQDGYLPEAILNFLALLGWNPGGQQEFFSLLELTKCFSLAKIQKAGAVFNLKRLDFFNQNYLRRLTLAELATKVRPSLSFEVSDERRFLAALELIRERLRFFAEADELLKFFFQVPEWDCQLFANQKMQVTLVSAKTALKQVLGKLAALKDWTEASLRTNLLALVQELNLKNGQVLWPMRVALTGRKFSPGAFEVAAVLGQRATLTRLSNALDKLENIR